MKILLVNRSDAEGGAARGAIRLLEGIHGQGVEARLYAQRRTTSRPLVAGPPPLVGKAVGSAGRILESVAISLWSGRPNGLFSLAMFPDGLSSPLAASAPDIVHLHWVARMMRLETLRHLEIPIIWTLHDSWPFTGGCFLPHDCLRYREACGRCPVLGSSREEDLSRWVWRRKRQAWLDLNLTLIAPSRWMKDAAEASSLFHGKRIEVIPNGLDTELFKPADKHTARTYFSLPQNKKLILYGAKSAFNDPNKGFHLLRQALGEISGSKQQDEIELIVFGASEPDRTPEMGFRTRCLGWQDDDHALALLYAAADVFVLPSIQENLPYAVMEAMACGTPCVAFRQGGTPDLIEHDDNGCLARPFDPADLAQCLKKMLENDDRRAEMGAKARRKVVQEFALEKVAGRHMALYHAILGKKDDRGLEDGRS